MSAEDQRVGNLLDPAVQRSATSLAPPPPERCFACGRVIHSRPTRRADTRDGQVVFVGPECARRIDDAGDVGYQPPLGGPRLWNILGQRDAMAPRSSEPVGWTAAFRQVAKSRTRGGPKTTAADVMVWEGQLHGRNLRITTTVRCIEPLESFITNSRMRLRDSFVGTFGHFVDLVVEPADVDDALLSDIEASAAAEDTRPCLARRKGERLRRPASGSNDHGA
jgi:hypothetical protein